MLAALDADNISRDQRDRIFTSTKDQVIDYFNRKARAKSMSHRAATTSAAHGRPSPRRVN